MRKMIVAAVAVVLAASVSLAEQLTVDVNVADTAWRSSGTAMFGGQNTGRIGTETESEMTSFVMPFRLPAFPDGQKITEASLNIFLTGGTFKSETSTYLTLLGGRTASGPASLAGDYNKGSVLFKSPALLYELPLNAMKISTPELTAFLQNIYNTDASAAGKYVFLTLAPDVPNTTRSRYIAIASGDHTPATNRPVLSLTTGAGK
jgi:hypothetical protein